MAVGGVVLQLIGQRRPQAAGIVPAKAQTDGDLVRYGKIHPVLGPGQDIRVIPQGLDGPIAVGALEGHGQIHRQVIPGQELHQLAQARQRTEGVGQLLRSLGGDALDAPQALRLPLDDQ